MTWSEINLIQRDKDIIFFGRGEWLTKSLPYLTKQAKFIVDNNPYEQGQIEENLKIFSPEKIKEYDLNNKIIVIPPSKPLRIKSPQLDLFFIKNFWFLKKGVNIKIPKKFLKNDC